MKTVSLITTLALLLGAGATAQDVPPDEAPQPRPSVAEGSDVAKQLVERIRKSLEEVNEALLDAADTDEIADEFDRALVNHRKAIRDIEELIDQIKYQQSSSGSGGGGDNQQQQMTSPQSGGARESDGQNAPDPSSAPEGGRQDEASGQQDQPQDQQGQQPRDGQTPADGMSDADGRQMDADSPPPEDPTAPFSRTDTDGRWGLLPPKLQERLMNLHVDDVPSRYRLHLDAYIRALNAQDDG